MEEQERYEQEDAWFSSYKKSSRKVRLLLVLCNGDASSQIQVGCEPLETVKNQNTVIVAALYDRVNFFRVGAEVYDSDVFIILCQIGNKTIGVTVFYNQNASFAIPFDGRVSVVATQKSFV